MPKRIETFKKKKKEIAKNNLHSCFYGMTDRPPDKINYNLVAQIF